MHDQSTIEGIIAAHEATGHPLVIMFILKERAATCVRLVDIDGKCHDFALSGNEAINVCDLDAL
jgi:hypothetical protein